MSFLSLKDVTESFVANNKHKFSSPDWGVIGILHTISSSIIPGQSYEIDKAKLGDKLNEMFSFGIKESRSNSVVYATFSNTWLESFFGKFDKKLSILDLAIWYYRKTNLPESIVSGVQLIDKFVADLHLPMDILSKFVDTNSNKPISLNNSIYSDDELLKALAEIYDFTLTNDSITLKAEGGMVVKWASDFGAGPFTQTLYASKGFANILLLTDFELSELYAEKRYPININSAIYCPLKESYTLQELAKELHNMNESLGTSGIHLFGLKFGKFLTKDINLKELCQLADISDNYNVELNKMRNVFKNISDHEFGVCFYDDVKFELPKAVSKSDNNIKAQFNYLRAMRTKPFLLLAGISGTGKSRIVKQMAFDSCPDNAVLRKDPTSPGNYCLVEVKPNWHDSTELLGYESKIGGDHYQLTPFIKFLAKAMLHPEVPFFVCLDEMNLAPVEQYFAEFLSVLESRTKINGHIVSEPLIKADIFKKYCLIYQLFDLKMDEKSNKGVNSTRDSNANYGKEGNISNEAECLTSDEKVKYGKENGVYELLMKDGLRIPENVVIIGTVNMDETTHQFSRKVIDRAMTIEMNLPEGDPFMDFFNNSSELAYRETPTSASLYLATETKASDVINELTADNAEKTEWLKGEVASILTKLNEALDGTPFKVAYRVQNELMLYFYQLWLEDKSAEWENILNTACDQILMMKVLPRIEGDEELLEKPLNKLNSFCEPYTNASKKLKEMLDRLTQSRFTSFWP